MRKVEEGKCSLWQGRKFRILLSKDSPVWHVGKVKKLEYFKKEENSDGSIVDWFLTMEFETTCKKKKNKNKKQDKRKKKSKKKQIDNSSKDGNDEDLLRLRLGDYVELKDLVSAFNYNGSFGVVVSDEKFNETGRYGIQVQNKDGHGVRKTKQFSIQPKNISKFVTLEEEEEKEEDTFDDNKEKKLIKKEWTWKFHRLHPATGGTLEGKACDCTSLLSLEWLEWLEDPHPMHSPSSSMQPGGIDITTFSSREDFFVELEQCIGTYGYYVHPSGNKRMRLDPEEPLGFHLRNFVEVRGTRNLEHNTTIDERPLSYFCPIESLPRREGLELPPTRMIPIRSDVELLGETNWTVPAYNRMAVEGNFTAEWNEGVRDEQLQTLKVFNYIDATGSEEPPLRKLMNLAKFMFYRFPRVDMGSRGQSDISIGHNVSRGSALRNCLTQNQRKYVCSRLTHWFLRQENI